MPSSMWFSLNLYLRKNEAGIDVFFYEFYIINSAYYSSKGYCKGPLTLLIKGHLKITSRICLIL